MDSDWNNRRRNDRPRDPSPRDDDNRGSFRRDTGDAAPRDGSSRREDDARGPYRRDARNDAPRGGGFRRDERPTTDRQARRPFDSPRPWDSSPRGGRDDARGEGRPSYRDRDRSPFQERRFDRDRPYADRDERPFRERTDSRDRPYQRDRDEARPFERGARDQDRFAGGERPFSPRGGRDDRPYNRGGSGEQFGGPRRGSDRPPFGGGRAGGDRPPFRGDRAGGERPPFGGDRAGRDRPSYGGRSTFERRRPFERRDDRPAFDQGRPLGTATHQGRKPVSEFERIQADVYGRWPVLESLRAGNVVKIYLAAGVNDSADHLQEMQTLAAEKHIPVIRVERFALDRVLGGVNHQGIAAATRPHRYATFDEVVAAAEQSESEPLLVLFDGVQDPQNLGSILRTAEAAGAQGAVLPKHQQASITPAVVRASAGATEHLKTAEVTNLRQSIETLKNGGYWIVGLDMEGGTDYDNFDVDSPIALIVGAEGRGLGRLVAEQCDYLVRLPMRGHIASLNASVAAGIVLYEIQRRRDESNKRNRGSRTSRSRASVAPTPVAEAEATEPVAVAEPAALESARADEPVVAETHPDETPEGSEALRALGQEDTSWQDGQQPEATHTEPETVPPETYDAVVEDLGQTEE
jgi:23S rRNA (guanosine2251-2'-O)-methyltransferase